MLGHRDRHLSLRLGDYRRVLLAALDHVPYPVALVTVTPPGVDYFTTTGYLEWNRTAAVRWKKLDRRVKSRLRRKGLRLRPLARIAQRQRRGLDHLHLVVALEHREDRIALELYVRYLKELAGEYGFGFVDDPFHKRRGKGGERRDMVFQAASVSGRYLCRYLSESDQLAALVEGRDHSFRPMWVAHELTQLSGVNCRRLRRVRHAYFVRRALDQGSRPTLPVWWRNHRERLAVLRLLRPSIVPAGP